MAPSDSESRLTDPHSRKPYVAPKVIFSELYAKGVMKNTSPGHAEYHSSKTSSTS
jgi:hypothetical protein